MESGLRRTSPPRFIEHPEALPALAARLGMLLAQPDESARDNEPVQIRVALEHLAQAVGYPLSHCLRSIAAVAPLSDVEALALLQGLDAGSDKELKLAQARALAVCQVKL